MGSKSDLEIRKSNCLKNEGKRSAEEVWSILKNPHGVKVSFGKAMDRWLLCSILEHTNISEEDRHLSPQLLPSL